MANCPRCRAEDAYVGGGPMDVECCNPRCYFYSEDWAIDRAFGQTEAPKDLSSQGEDDDTTPVMPFTLTCHETSDVRSRMTQLIDKVIEDLLRGRLAGG